MSPFATTILLEPRARRQRGPRSARHRCTPAQQDYAVLETSFIGHNAGEVGDAIRISRVASARLEWVLCLQDANRITADASCGKLTLEDCVYKMLNSSSSNAVML